MSKQEDALKHWVESHKTSKIELLIAQATDYSFPAGQATAGIQLATVEVPRLLEYIEELKEQINGSGAQPAQVVGL